MDAATGSAPAAGPDSRQVTILFDGVCVICNAGCRFVAKRDREGRFRYVSIQSPEGRPLAQSLGIDPDDPETFAVLVGGQGYVKSEAALRIARELPGWRWAWAFHWLPRALRDPLYDLVARNRYRWFGRYESCVISPFAPPPPRT
jgi:predicted DCC family thiol-disulfide oxidoreductase YuxK